MDESDRKLLSMSSPDSGVCLCDLDHSFCQQACIQDLFPQACVQQSGFEPAYNPSGLAPLGLCSLRSASQDSEYSLDVSPCGSIDAEEFLEDLGFAGCGDPAIPERFLPSLIERLSKFSEYEMRSLNDRIVQSIGCFRRKEGKRRWLRYLSLGTDANPNHQHKNECLLCPSKCYPLHRSNTGPSKFSDDKTPSAQIDNCDNSKTDTLVTPKIAEGALERSKIDIDETVDKQENVVGNIRGDEKVNTCDVFNVESEVTNSEVVKLIDGESQDEENSKDLASHFEFDANINKSNTNTCSSTLFKNTEHDNKELPQIVTQDSNKSNQRPKNIDLNISNHTFNADLFLDSTVQDSNTLHNRTNYLESSGSCNKFQAAPQKSNPLIDFMSSMLNMDNFDQFLTSCDELLENNSKYIDKQSHQCRECLRRNLAIKYGIPRNIRKRFTSRSRIPYNSGNFKSAIKTISKLGKQIQLKSQFHFLPSKQATQDNHQNNISKGIFSSDFSAPKCHVVSRNRSVSLPTPSLKPLPESVNEPGIPDLKNNKHLRKLSRCNSFGRFESETHYPDLEPELVKKFNTELRDKLPRVQEGILLLKEDYSKSKSGVSKVDEIPKSMTLDNPSSKESKDGDSKNANRSSKSEIPLNVLSSPIRVESDTSPTKSDNHLENKIKIHIKHQEISNFKTVVQVSNVSSPDHWKEMSKTAKASPPKIDKRSPATKIKIPINYQEIHNIKPMHHALSSAKPKTVIRTKDGDRKSVVADSHSSKDGQYGKSEHTIEITDILSPKNHPIKHEIKIQMNHLDPKLPASKREAAQEKQVRTLSKMLANLNNIFIEHQQNTITDDKSFTDNITVSKDKLQSLSSGYVPDNINGHTMRRPPAESLLRLLKSIDAPKRHQDKDPKGSRNPIYTSGFRLMINCDETNDLDSVVYYSSVSFDVDMDEGAQTHGRVKENHNQLISVDRQAKDCSNSVEKKSHLMVKENYNPLNSVDTKAKKSHSMQNSYSSASKHLEELQMAIKKAKESRISASRELHLLMELLQNKTGASSKYSEATKTENNLLGNETIQENSVEKNKQALSDLREKSKQEILHDSEFFQAELLKMKKQNEREWKERLERMEERLSQQESQLAKVKDENQNLKKKLEMRRMDSIASKPRVIPNGYSSDLFYEQDLPYEKSSSPTVSTKQDCDRLQEQLLEAERKADNLNLLLTQKTIECNKLQITLSKQTKEMIELEKSFMQLQCRQRKALSRPLGARVCSRSAAFTANEFYPKSSPPASPSPSICP